MPAWTLRKRGVLACLKLCIGGAVFHYSLGRCWSSGAKGNAKSSAVSLFTGQGEEMQKFLEGDLREESSCRDFEEASLEMNQAHARECNAGPFASFRRIVPYKQRDGHVPVWKRLGLEHGESPVLLERIALEGSELLSHEECDSIVEESEAANAWTKMYPHASPARQALLPDRVPVESLPRTFKWLSRALGRKILPALASAFPLSVAARLQNLRLYQATVLRYRPNASAPVSTDVHQDFSFLTCTVPLSNPDEYEGGGTWIEHLDLAVKLSKGHSLLHPGCLWHAGQAVTSGRRYVLALFFHSTLAPNYAKRFEESAKELIALGRSQPAAQEFEFSLRAMAAERLRVDYLMGPEDVKTNYHHELLWGVVCIVQHRQGQLEEAGRSEEKFSEAIRYLRKLDKRSGKTHPSLTKAMKNWEQIQKLKSPTLLPGGAEGNTR